MFLFIHCLAVSRTLPLIQSHNLKPAEALKKLEFMKGEWSGVQNFNPEVGASAPGQAKNTISDAIGARYLCEMLSTTLPGRKPTDTRHFITFDSKSQVFKAWWFTDTSVGPMEFEGSVDGTKLVLLNKPIPTATGPGTTLRATYENASPDKLTYTVEMKTQAGWTRLFTTSYSKH